MIDITKTYCNPTPLPDYPLGRNCFREGWAHRADYRETADPSVIFEDGVWYLYPSCGMVYWSEDYIHWNHKKMYPYDCGYAPTVVNHKGKYYLCGSLSDLFMAESPIGCMAAIHAAAVRRSFSFEIESSGTHGGNVLPFSPALQSR